MLSYGTRPRNKNLNQNKNNIHSRGLTSWRVMLAIRDKSRRLSATSREFNDD